MPYTRKKRTFKRRPAQPRRQRPKNLDRRIRKLERADELKYHDVLNTTALGTGTLLSLNLIPQGDDFNNRVGEEITSRYLNMKLRFTQPASTDSSNIRTILMWDKQANGASPVVYTSTNMATGILDDTLINYPTLSPHNYRASERYTVLWDKTFVINPESSAVQKIITVKKNFNLKQARIKYSGSGSAITDIASRNLVFLIIGTATSTAAPVLTFRHWYTDA